MAVNRLLGVTGDRNIDYRVFILTEIPTHTKIYLEYMTPPRFRAQPLFLSCVLSLSRAAREFVSDHVSRSLL